MSIDGAKPLDKYLKYWNIDRLVFQPPKLLSQLYIPESWQSKLERLTLFAGQNASLIALSTPPGHCKSTIARWLYNSIDTKSQEIALLSLFKEEHLDNWLLAKLAKYFEVDHDAKKGVLESVAASIERLNETGRLVTLIIDEAHHMASPKAYAELHSLIGVQSLASLSLNCILIGNEQMSTIIAKTPQIRSRLNLNILFSELNLSETTSYIKHSLARSSISPKIFTRDAIAAVQEHTAGIFSQLNGLLENCLIEAFLKQKKTIDSQVVEDAILYLPFGGVRDEADHSSPIPPKGVRRLIDASQKIRDLKKNESGDDGKSVELSSLFYKADDK